MRAQRNEAMEWIDIKVKKPDTKEPVVYARPNINGGYHVGIAYWVIGKKWNPEMESVNSPEGFTHWIPLPEPPKQ